MRIHLLLVTIFTVPHGSRQPGLNSPPLVSPKHERGYIMGRFITMLLLASALPLSAWSSGGHYPVDDADIVAPGGLQIESWFTHVDGNNSELAFLPAWTPAGTRLELTAGLYRIREEGDDFNRFEPAAKWQFLPPGDGHISAALSIAAGYEDGDWSDWLVNLPISFHLAAAPVVIHANVGWLRERTDNNDRAFLGAGFEWGASETIDLIGQVYREGADAEPEAQLGLRRGFDGALEHLDFAVGRTLRDQRDWFLTAGLTATF